MSDLARHARFFDRLHRQWRQINETHTLEDIVGLALNFATEGLGFTRAVVFIHHDDTGMFKVHFQRGYTQADELLSLNITQLLLSGEIVESLRLRNEPIIHTTAQPQAAVRSFLPRLSMTEALLAPFGGDVEAPHGIIVVGNGPSAGLVSADTASVSDPLVCVALQNLILHLSNAVNTSMFYRAWGQEKLLLQDNIDVRTQQIREQKEQFETIFQASKDGIAVLDVHTTAFLDANPAYLEMTGFNRAELLHTSCLALTPPEEVALSQEVLSQVIEKGYVRDHIKTYILKDGRRIKVDMSLVLMHDQERILVNSKEITSRYELEQALLVAKNKSDATQDALAQKNRALEDLTANLESMVDARTEELARALAQAQEAAKAKSEFLATMSHEIRTPMNGVLGMTELLDATPLSSDQRALLHTLQSSGQSLLTIINDILDFSKIDAGKLDLEHIAFSLPDLMDELKGVFSVMAHARDLELTLDYPDDLPAQVMGDITRLRQVFFNLISNAIKFTHQGSVHISIAATAKPDGYQATIRDTGIGMSAAVQTKLFHAFTQANASTTRQYGGTGLGLVISAALVKRMRGRIWVDSAVNQGSTFYFTFHAPQAKAAVAPEVAPPAGPRPMGHLRVLVAEDHHVNRMLVVRFLQKMGIEPDVAYDGLDAVKQMQTRDYDAVLMDIQMPHMDGLMATRHIREQTHLRQPHIIALTANAFAEDRAMCCAAGMNDFVSKPVTMARLAEALAQVPSAAGSVQDHA